VTGCPWNATQAAQMNFAQSADTLLLFHPDMQPQRILRGGSHSSWTVGNMPMSNIPTFDFGSGAEAVVSGTRGWPECGTFHSGRLYLGGLRSRPSTIIASKVADFFNFDRGTALDDEGFMVTLDTDQVNAIHQLYSGKALQIFTSGSEAAITVAPPITPTNISLEVQTRRGCQRFVPVVEIDGATMFVQRGGAGLRQFIYSDLSLQYQSDLLSLLAPHLIVQPTDLAARKGAAQDDADHVLLVRADGLVTVLTTLRAQEVAAFTRWETAGQVKSACALQSGEVFFATLRNGSIRVEQWDESCRMDASVLATGSGITSVTGLAHLNGQEVGIITDGAWQGTTTVSGGAVTLPRAADAAEVGLFWQPEYLSMPLEPRDPTGALIGRKCRVVTQSARVKDTGLFEVDGTPVILRKLGASPATPLGTAPPVFTGDVIIRGRLGWDYRQQIRVTQAVPGPFTLLAFGHELALAG
jgi:hypothetical protein